MHRTSIVSRWFLIPLLGLVCLMIGGCKEEGAARSTLQLSMVSTQAKARSLLPKDTPLEVSHYVVEGEGPQGTTFSVMSTTQSLEVEGLLIGNWTITAVGQNNSGVDLVRGQATVNLTPEPKEVTIELGSLAGKGLLSVELLWNHLNVSEPSLAATLTDEAGNTQTLTPTTNNIATGSVLYSGDYQAGSYLLKAQLFSGSVPVAGCAEVVRIVGNRTTEGQIELKLDKYANVPTALKLVNNLGVPVECTIAGISENVNALQPLTASLTTGDSSSLEVDWYLDGVHCGSTLTCTITPSSGSHRLDVIAKGALLASSGSASISFTAAVNGEAGVPILVSTVQDSTDGMHIGVDAHAAFLPDGKILLASNQHQTIQVCRIVRESLEVVHTYSAADGFNAAGVTDLFVDHATYRVAIADSSNPGLTVYQYDLGSSQLVKLFSRDNTYGVKRPGTLSFPYLTDLTLLRSTGVLYGLNPAKDHVVQTNLYANSQSALYTLNYFQDFPQNQPAYTGLAITASGSSAALVRTNGSLLKIFRKSSFNEPFTNPVDFTSPSTPYLANVAKVLFLNDNNLVYATNKDVGRFVYTTTWEQMEVFSSNLDGITMESIQQLVANNTGTRLYVLAENSLLTFQSPSPTYSLSYVTATSLGSYQASRVDMSPKQDQMVITSSTGSSLLLCKIP